jgi:hypothetical protein
VYDYETRITHLHSINHLAIKTEKQFISCEFGTEFVNLNRMKFIFQKFNTYKGGANGVFLPKELSEAQIP